MRINKKIKTILLIIFSLSIIVLVTYFIMLNQVGKAFESIGESLNVPSETLKELHIGTIRYQLIYSPGAAFTSREWAVVANREHEKKLLLHISAHDGQIKDIAEFNLEVHHSGEKPPREFETRGISLDGD
jgi:hypothetical protein